MPHYDLNVNDYLRIFKRRKFIVIAVFLVVTLGSYYYLNLQPPIYQSAATVKVMERRNIAGLLTEWITYTPADVMESQAKVITGFPVMKKVAERLELIEPGATGHEVHKIVRGLQGKISTKTISRTNIIKITVTGGDPIGITNIANTVAAVYIQENLVEKKKQASTARQFIEEQLTELEDRLVEGEERIRIITEQTKDVKLAQPIQIKLIELEFQLATLLQKYTEKHPHVVRLREQIRDLERQLESFSGEDLQYARLMRETEVNKKLFALLKERLEEARITEAQKVGDVSLVDPAIVPDNPIGQDAVVGTIIGAVMGLVLGIGLAFLSEAMDTSIGTIDDVEKLIKLPVLGVIPSLATKQGVFTRMKRRLFQKKMTASEEIEIRLVVHREPKSPITESYRNLRTNLKLSDKQKTVLITSAGPREGKTTVVTNLGLTTAQRGMKTLLVSSDLRRPALAKTFGVTHAPGFNEVIAGTAKLDNAILNIADIMLGTMHLDDIMQSSGIENISILPCGHIPANPAEVLESKELPHLMDELKKRFDVIFFDSPPVLLVTDPNLLAPRVDAVIICHEIGKTARAALLRAKTQLDNVGANLVGVVLNHITPQSEMITYPYYQSYYAYGYYGEDMKKLKKRKGEKEEA